MGIAFQPAWGLTLIDLNHLYPKFIIGRSLFLKSSHRLTPQIDRICTKIIILHQLRTMSALSWCGHFSSNNPLFSCTTFRLFIFIKK